MKKLTTLIPATLIACSCFALSTMTQVAAGAVFPFRADLLRQADVPSAECPRACVLGERCQAFAPDGNVRPCNLHHRITWRVPLADALAGNKAAGGQAMIVPVAQNAAVARGERAYAAGAYKTALKLYQAMCRRRRVAEGCYRAGEMLKTGDGVPKDPEGAREYFDLGCKAGHSEACAALAALPAGNGSGQPAVSPSQPAKPPAAPAVVQDQPRTTAAQKEESSAQAKPSTAPIAQAPQESSKPSLRTAKEQHLVGEPITVYYDFGNQAGRSRSMIGVAEPGSPRLSSDIRPALLGPSRQGNVELEGLEEGTYEIRLAGPRGKVLARIPLQVTRQLVQNETVSDVCGFPENNDKRSQAEFVAAMQQVDNDLQAGEIEAAWTKATQLICDGQFAVSDHARAVNQATAAVLDKDDHGRTTGGAAELRSHLAALALPAFSDPEESLIFLYASLVPGDKPVQRCLAARLLMVSAMQGHVPSQLLTAQAVANGSACAWNAAPEEAVLWYEKAMSQGSPRGTAYLGLAYLLGQGVSANSDKGLSLLTEAAKTPDTEAQYLLGTAYAEGLGIAPDRAKAQTWLTMAADDGHAVAQTVLGEMLWEDADALFREILATDEAGKQEIKALRKEAVAWFEKAANLGYADAQYRLGKAINSTRWYERAAMQGHTDAQAALGFAYWGAADYAAAVEWLGRAATAGHARAQTYLGRAYLTGQGVQQDDEQGIKWLQKAAKQNDAGAEETLAWAYRNGRGVPQNGSRAAYWNNRAAQHGSELAATMTLQGAFRKFAVRTLGGADIYHAFLADIGRSSGAAYQEPKCETIIGFSCNPGIDQWAINTMMSN